MRRWLKPIDAILTWAGKELAKLWLAMLSLAILLGFPVAGFALSFLMAWKTMRWIGGGGWSFFPAWLIFGLFLSIYVWNPFVEPATLKIAHLITSEMPD